MRESDANKVSAEQLFLNVTARIRQDGRTQQHPTISKTLEARRRLTLFGDQPAGDPGQTEVTVVVDQLNETLTIQNGSDIGLTKGSEFKRKDSPAVRIRVSEEVTELGRAVAEIVPPAKLSDIQTGDVFEQDRWSPAGKPNLKVWIPPAKLSAADLHAIAAELSKLRSSDRVQWVDDPTEEDVTHLISFDESGWQLVKLDGTIAKLGNQPTADAVLKLLPASGQSKLFVYLPPSTELRNKIKLGEGTQKSAIAVTRTRDEAVYLLVGRLRKTATETKVEYAWVLPAATQGEAHNSANSTQPNNKPPPESLPLPPLTTWIDGNAAVADHNPVTALEDMALRLGKIKDWLGLTSPPQERGHIFPYRLVIKNASQPNIEISNGSELVECEKYVVELVAEPFALNPLPRQRYVYVLGLDKSGNSSLLYGSGNESNRWPTKGELDSGTALPRILLDDAAFIVIGPKARCGINPNTGKPYDKGTLGNETYILLTTEDPLPLPELLEFKGVRSPEDIQAGKSRADKSDLQDLLSSIYGPTMSTRGTTSLNWSVQQLTFRSVEKKR